MSEYIALDPQLPGMTGVDPEALTDSDLDLYYERLQQLDTFVHNELAAVWKVRTTRQRAHAPAQPTYRYKRR
jgi:hypothetical protein